MCPTLAAGRREWDPACSPAGNPTFPTSGSKELVVSRSPDRTLFQAAWAFVLRHHVAFWNVFKYVLAFGLLGYVVWRNWEPGSDAGLEAVWIKHIVRGQPIHTGF